jgi:hypothetical protein
MDDAKEFVASLLKTVRDRLGNPLVSAFAIAWLIWNFRVVLVLIGQGDGGWAAKITYLDTRLMATWWAWALHGFAIPLLFAIIWIYILPPLLREVALHHERQANTTRTGMLEVLGQTPLTEDDRVKLLEQIRKERKAWVEERAELVNAAEQALRERTPTNISTLPTSSTPLPPPPESRSTPDEKVELNSSSTATPPSRSSDPPNADDFFDEGPKEKAKLLGLRLGEMLEARPGAPTVTFNGYEIRWPWTLNRMGRFGLSQSIANALERWQVDQNSLMVLFAIRDQGKVTKVNDSPTILERTVETKFGLSKFDRDTALTQLVELRLVASLKSAYGGTEYEMSSTGRLFLAWLLRLGFEFRASQ